MSEVFVSAVHPNIGRLYWAYTPADVGYPDHCSITDWNELATKFPKGWRDHDYLHWLHKSHIYRVFNPEDVFADYAVDDDEENDIHEPRLSGLLAGLHAKSGQTVEEFRLWMFRADWVDVPALQVVES
ncbi:hypothetical protein [Pseudomonas syringae group genomosp. 3]|uniref:hypothetical protein n=1 Tax=Pseudomonas syringae group genomosp. 3 TaxID=251701 RepID=UPI001067EF85|nr:hypothetical protein [Pseudomonas syringae group genomosp. 3]TES71926.1 hypothetical protein E2N89_30270 [Pseudomonas syringae pv. tomato]